MFFTLFLTPGITPPVPVNHGGGGGHVPVSLSSVSVSNRGRAVQMRNVPLPPRSATATPYYMPRNGEAGKQITVKVKLGGKEATKEYIAMDKSKVKVNVEGLFTQFMDEALTVIAERLFEQINIKD